MKKNPINTFFKKGGLYQIKKEYQSAYRIRHGHARLEPSEPWIFLRSKKLDIHYRLYILYKDQLCSIDTWSFEKTYYLKTDSVRLS